MSFQVQYLVLLTYFPKKYQTLSGLILILVSESRKTVEQGRNRCIGILRWASLLCISNHWFWLLVVLQLWYPFNANWSSRKSGWHWISLDPLVCGFLFLQLIITDRNPTKGPGPIIESIIYCHLPRHSWPVILNTTIYSLFIDWIFDHITSAISIYNRHWATYPPGRSIRGFRESYNLWLKLIGNHVRKMGWSLNKGWRYSRQSQGWGELHGNCDWLYDSMISKQS